MTERPRHEIRPQPLPRELVVPKTSSWFNLEVAAARCPEALRAAKQDRAAGSMFRSTLPPAGKASAASR